jgi:cytochrome c
MNKFVIIAAAGLVLSSGAHAVDAEKAKALAQSKNCLACHAIDKKLVGPAYTEVSKKY